MRLIYLFCVLALDWFDWLIYFICVPSRLTKRIYPGTRRRKIQFCVSNSFIWDCFDWLIDFICLFCVPARLSQFCDSILGGIDLFVLCASLGLFWLMDLLLFFPAARWMKRICLVTRRRRTRACSAWPSPPRISTTSGRTTGEVGGGQSHRQGYQQHQVEQQGK